jgi:hypothetical protein
MRFVADWCKAGQVFSGECIAIQCVTTPQFRWAEAWKNHVKPLRPEDCGDFVVIRATEKPEHALVNARRSDLALIIRDGLPQIGDPEVMAQFPQVQTVPAVLDGRPKAIHVDLARRIHRCSLKESGLEVDALPQGRMFQVFSTQRRQERKG